RARRRSTPLLSDSSTEAGAKGATAASRTAASRPTKATSRKKATTSTASRKPALRVVSGPDGAPPTAQSPSTSRSAGRRKPPARRSTSTAGRAAAAASTTSTGTPGRRTGGTPDSGQAIVPGLAELVSVLLSAGQLTSRTLGQAAGAAAGEEWERRFADTIEFLQRRVRGDYDVDDF